MAAGLDVAIRGATMIDGLGGPAKHVDVGIKDGLIDTVGDLSGRRAGEEVQAEGQVLAPGFVDVHTHDDFAALLYPEMAFKLRGGVTTCVVGNCGFGAAPFVEACVLGKAMHPDLSVSPYEGYAGYMARLDEQPPGVNISVLAGHGTLRLAAMGTADRAPDDREMRHMESVLDEALDAGVVGMSSGLIYEPGKYAQTEELIALAKRLKPVGGLYATHMRNEADQLVASVEEAITIGAAAEVPVQISHHKASGRDNWGLVNDSLALIEAAQHRGESVHADQYPYTAGSTLLRAILDNGAFTNESGGIGRLGPEDVTVASADGKPDWEGRSVASLAAEFELPPRAAAERVLESVPGTTAVVHNMDEADVRRVMQHPSTMIGSDGIPTVQGRPHPRLYNTFARVLGHYVRDVGLFSLETAVYRMTGFSAQKFGLRDRGVVRAGAVADLVLFNPASIIDQGTFDDPNQYPDGIDRVWVNGKLSVNGGELAGPPAGRALRRTNG